MLPWWDECRLWRRGYAGQRGLAWTPGPQMSRHFIALPGHVCQAPCETGAVSRT
jgi:hypothetical protein